METAVPLVTCALFNFSCSETCRCFERVVERGKGRAGEKELRGGAKGGGGKGRRRKSGASTDANFHFRSAANSLSIFFAALERRAHVARNGGENGRGKKEGYRRGKGREVGQGEGHGVILSHLAFHHNHRPPRREGEKKRRMRRRRGGGGRDSKKSGGVSILATGSLFGGATR